MIVLVGILLAAKQGSAKILDHTGTHFVVFSPDVGLCGPCRIFSGNKVESEGFVAFGTLVNLIPHEFVGKIRNLSSVADAAPYLQYRFRDPNDGYLFTVGGFDLNNAMVVGTTCCAATDIVKGRFLAEDDTNKVLLEQAYAQLRQINIDDTIIIAEEEFSVIGIINPGIRPAKADIYMLYKDAERLIDPQLPNLPIQGNANLILVEVAQSFEQDRAIQAVKSLYPDLVISSYACYKPASRAQRINAASITLLIIVIGFLTVLLAIVSQLTSLVERRRELGILKTIGFSNSQIMSQVILESVLQAAIGSIIATLIIILILPAVLLKPLAAMNITLSNSLWLQISIVAVGLSLLGGLIAGIIPACWAGYKRPAVLLRCF
jgi:putative ABC transport system permease protein